MNSFVKKAFYSSEKAQKQKNVKRVFSKQNYENYRDQENKNFFLFSGSIMYSFLSAKWPPKYSTSFVNKLHITVFRFIPFSLKRWKKCSMCDKCSSTVNESIEVLSGKKSIISESLQCWKVAGVVLHWILDKTSRAFIVIVPFSQKCLTHL